MLQGAVARLYPIVRSDFSHILRTFPLVPGAERDRALSAFDSEQRPSPVAPHAV
jgi:hypothetical protein